MLRETYPTSDRVRLTSKVTSSYVEQLIAKVTAGFKGDVGVVPRQFLRHFVDVLDLADAHDQFDPMAAEGFKPEALTEDEQRLRQGLGSFDAEPEDVKNYEAVVF